jgi:hypothetical protein
MRASPRPPWRTLLLALLLAAVGCTSRPASQPPAPSVSRPAPQPPATTSSGPAGVKLSGAVRLPAGYSGGLVTVKGLTGQRRPDPDGGRPQLAVRVAGAAWVGKLPARVWIPGPGGSCPDCVVLDPVRLGEKGSQWVVTVRDTDAMLIDAWPVWGRQVGVPQGRQLPIADDVDGGNPQVVDVAALKARAGRR